MMQTLNRFYFFVFCLALFLGTLATAIVLPLLPLQIDALLKEAATLADLSRWAGLAVATAPLAATLTLPVWREVVHAGRGRDVLLAIWALSGLLLATMSKAHTVDQIVVLRLGLGCLGSVPVLALAMAPLLGPERTTGRRSVTLLAAVLAAFALGAPLGGFLDRAIGLRLAFIFASLLSGTAALVLALGYHQPLAALPETLSPEPVPTRRWPWIGALLFVGTATGAVVPLIPLFVAHALEVATDMIGVWSGLAIGAICLSGLIGGLSAILIADILPLRAAAIIGCVFAGGFAWLMGTSDHIVNLIAWSIAWAYPIGAVLASLLLMPARTLPDNARPDLAAPGWAALCFGGALGSLLGAYAGADRPELMFAVSILALVLAMVVTPWVMFKQPVETVSRPQS